MIGKWLHLDFEVGDPWMLPIMAAANRAIAQRSVPGIPEELRELSLHLSTRLDMLPRIGTRISVGETNLYSAAAAAHTPRHVFTPSQTGAVVRVADALIYDLLVDIDSLLFELNALAELMKALFVAVYSHVGKPFAPNQAGRMTQKVLVEADQDVAWFQKLDENRNLFAHNATPYLAIDISKAPWDLIIMKKNLSTFSNSDEYLLLSQLIAVVRGFDAARNRLQEHLVELYAQAGEA